MTFTVVKSSHPRTLSPDSIRAGSASKGRLPPVRLATAPPAPEARGTPAGQGGRTAEPAAHSGTRRRSASGPPGRRSRAGLNPSQPFSGERSLRNLGYLLVEIG